MDVRIVSLRRAQTCDAIIGGGPGGRIFCCDNSRLANIDAARRPRWPGGIEGPAVAFRKASYRHSWGKPEKYDWLEHAERNANYAAAKEGSRLRGCTIYVDLVPCVSVPARLCSSGIVDVVTSKQRCDEYSGDRKSHLAWAGITLSFA